MGYFKKSIKGFGWMAGLRFSTRAIAVLRVAIIARWLGPEKYGQFAVASLVLAFLETITETGINTVLIQNEVDFKKYLDTAWVVSIIRGLVIGILIYILSPLIIFFFKTPESLPALRLISVVPILRGFINPAIVGFQKELKFRTEFKLRFSIYLVDTVTSLLFVFITRASEGIVWGMLVGVIVELFYTLSLVKPKPHFRFDMGKLIKVLKRGGWMTLTGILNYLFTQGDDFIVGKMLGIEALGLYQVAYKISTLPITEVAGVIHKVAFPIFTKIQNEKQRIIRAFQKTLKVSMWISIPFSLLILFLSKSIINIFLGPEWIEIVGVLRILAIYGMLRASTSLTSALFLAIKKQEYIATINFIATVILLITIIPLINKFGISGAGYSALIGWLLALPVMYYFYQKEFKPQKHE